MEKNPPPFWHGAGQILKQDRNFDWFLVSRVLSQFATMGFAFYIVYALRRFDMDAVTAGFLTATLTISQTVANAGMGWLGDRIGHRWMLIIGAAAAALSSLAGLVRSIARLVLSNVCPDRLYKCVHLDKRYDDDCGFQR